MQSVGCHSLPQPHDAGREDEARDLENRAAEPRDELLELAFDELVGQVELPEPDAKRWREQLTQMMYDFHRVLVSHRDAALAGLGRVPTTPNTLAASEAMVNLMRAGGLSDKVIALGIDQLVLFVTGSAFEDSLYEYGAMSPEEVEEYFGEIHRFISALPPERFPGLASIADEMVAYDGDERLRFGLDALIAGLEAVSRRG